MGKTRYLGTEDWEFDNARIGALLDEERKSLGYGSTQKFLKAIEETTGCRISKTSFYEVLDGERPLRTQELFAVCFTLYGMTGWREAVLRYMEAGFKTGEYEEQLSALIDGLKKQSPQLANFYEQHKHDLAKAAFVGTPQGKAVRETMETAGRGESLIEVVWAKPEEEL